MKKNIPTSEFFKFVQNFRGQIVINKHEQQVFFFELFHAGYTPEQVKSKFKIISR